VWPARSRFQVLCLQQTSSLQQKLKWGQFNLDLRLAGSIFLWVWAPVPVLQRRCDMYCSLTHYHTSSRCRKTRFTEVIRSSE
jgi:hypothetical protein